MHWQPLQTDHDEILFVVGMTEEEEELEVPPSWVSDPNSEVRRPPAAPKQTLLETLRGLGVDRGDTLLVHSSFKACRATFGTTEPMMALDQLFEAVGTTFGGNIMMPTFCHGCPSVFDLEQSDGKSGALSEVMRRLPIARRSQHPTHAVSVVGVDADSLTRGHTGEAFGLGSPLDRLAALPRGKVLLLGVNHMASSLIHLAETYAGIPKRCKYGEPPPFCEMRVGGKPCGRHQLGRTASCSVAFEAVALILKRGGVLRYANRPGCTLQLITSAKRAVELVAKALCDDPKMLLCGDPHCVACTTTAELLARGLRDKRSNGEARSQETPAEKRARADAEALDIHDSN